MHQFVSVGGGSRQSSGAGLDSLAVPYGGGDGTGSRQSSGAGLDSLAVPYADADDDEDETPVTTPTTACPTPTSALPPPPSTPSTPGPTAEQLYHMMLARAGSSRRRRRPGSSHITTAVSVYCAPENSLNSSLQNHNTGNLKYIKAHLCIKSLWSFEHCM